MKTDINGCATCPQGQEHAVIAGREPLVCNPVLATLDLHRKNVSVIHKRAMTAIASEWQTAEDALNASEIARYFGCQLEIKSKRDADAVATWYRQHNPIMAYGWSPFSQPVYGGHNYCGYFVHNTQTAWYLGGVDEAVLVEMPLPNRKERWQLQQGQYSTYTPILAVTDSFRSEAYMSRYAAPMPERVRRLHEIAKDTGLFHQFLVASPEAAVFHKSEAANWRCDPILLGEKWLDRHALGTYAMEWLVIAVWDLATDLAYSD